MSIVGASNTLVSLLRDQLTTNEDLGEYSVELYTTRQFKEPANNKISLFLYRIEIDEARRQVETRSNLASSLQSSKRVSLGLELYYLLTVWGMGSAFGEHAMLQACMNVFDEFAIIPAELIDSSQSDWEANDNLRISLTQQSNEDMMRLWDSLESPYQLSVAYIVRTVRLRPREVASELATSRSLVVGNRGTRQNGNTP
jgi:hypothetical protein